MYLKFKIQDWIFQLPTLIKLERVSVKDRSSFNIEWAIFPAYSFRIQDYKQQIIKVKCAGGMGLWTFVLIVTMTMWDGEYSIRDEIVALQRDPNDHTKQTVVNCQLLGVCITIKVELFWFLNLLTMKVPDEYYSRSVSCALNKYLHFYSKM